MAQIGVQHARPEQEPARVAGMRRALGDVGVFGAAVLGMPLRDYQLRVARAVFESIRAGHGLQFTVLMPRQAARTNYPPTWKRSCSPAPAVRRQPGQVCADVPAPAPHLDRTASAGAGQPPDPGAAGGCATATRSSSGLLASSSSPPSHAPTSSAPPRPSCSSVTKPRTSAPTSGTRTFARWARPRTPRRSCTAPWLTDDLLRALDRGQSGGRGQGRSPPPFGVDWREVARRTPAYGQYVEGEIARAVPPDHPHPVLAGGARAGRRLPPRLPSSRSSRASIPMADRRLRRPATSWPGSTSLALTRRTRRAS